MYYWSIFPVAPSTANVNLIKFLQKKKKRKVTSLGWPQHGNIFVTNEDTMNKS